MKIILLGDSITQGLGSKKVNFLNELRELMRPDDVIVNMALTGTTIGYVSEIMGEIVEEQPDIAVLLYGNVDAQIRPSTKGRVYRHIPKRYRGANINRRPFYSHRWYRNLLEHADNVLRSVFRRLVLLFDGTEQWVPYEQYCAAFDKACATLAEKGITPVICSTVYIDDGYFHGSDEQYRCYNEFMENYAREHQYAYVDLYQTFRQLVEDSGWKAYFNKDRSGGNGLY